MCVINKFLFYLEFDFPECDTESTLILLDAETKSINFLHLQRPPGCIQPKLLFLALAGRGGWTPYRRQSWYYDLLCTNAFITIAVAIVAVPLLASGWQRSSWPSAVLRLCLPSPSAYSRGIYYSVLSSWSSLLVSDHDDAPCEATRGCVRRGSRCHIPLTVRPSPRRTLQQVCFLGQIYLAKWTWFKSFPSISTGIIYYDCNIFQL